jgi:hypothetical protein
MDFLSWSFLDVEELQGEHLTGLPKALFPMEHMRNEWSKLHRQRNAFALNERAVHPGVALC